jgi:hypothetical protein
LFSPRTARGKATKLKGYFVINQRFHGYGCDPRISAQNSERRLFESSSYFEIFVLGRASMRSLRPV